ncbi:hypothetical protein TSTA_064880 [Talaromyces stipitatus ATCC 10500]|uniref:Uncharacterized protein n=1 Tax=Talaromyces stipitatus (strain ATCC 10500 / CBS 375.48 / QM 6759 / NRRL 1006) TaxID=441959 RepID=B8LTE7_TALSN|nr:uncharacterized protein TSTA_064880 [Talaromyces stipitatus ATCC 10500]EED23025.1 hypothetical protein TSTA_064880 [Talaromyces stipitatus ATCC 10500]
MTFKERRLRAVYKVDRVPCDSGGIISSSPELPSTTLSDSASSPSTTTTLSSFPLPYRSQSATDYRSPHAEYPPATYPLTSQESRPYYSSPSHALPGRFSIPANFHLQTSSESQQKLEPNPTTNYFSSPRNWQSRDFKWPQSRSQSSTKYVPKSRRYDQRRVTPRNGFLHPGKKYHLPGPNNQAVDRKVQDGRKKRIPALNDGSTTRSSSNDNQPSERPRLVNYALPASLEDDEKEEEPPSHQKSAMSVSRYVSPKDNEDDSVQSIRQSQYWTQLKHDPIFSDLSTGSETISISDLKQRRDQILQNHAPPPRQTVVMKEQGTQTDPEEIPFSQPRSPTEYAIRARESSKQEQQQFITPRPKSVPHSRKRSYTPKQGNQTHHRTSSLTDTDSPRTHYMQQIDGRRGSKRSRSVTEDDHEETDSFAHRRKLGDGGGSNQGPFYSRKR